MQNERLFHLLNGIFMLSGIPDVISTAVLLSSGAKEANPFMRYILEQEGPITAAASRLIVPVAIGLTCSLLVRLAPKELKKQTVLSFNISLSLVDIGLVTAIVLNTALIAYIFR